MLSKEYDISVLSERGSVKFEYRKPAKQLWETEAKWFTEEEIINDKVGDLGRYVGVISIFLDNN
jgi:hypothetical protein